jgi:TPP-dependent pyruvate/acetoin dehydrogenase alpha subunit
MTSFIELEKQYLELSPKPYAVPLGDLGPIIEKCTLAMSKRDWLVTGPRGKAAALLRGCSAERLVDLKEGVASYKIAPSSLSPANRALHAVGLAISSKRPVLCLLGLASAANGSYYEALNISVLKKAPVIFVLIVQDLENVPMSAQVAGSPAKVASALGLDTTTVSSKDTSLQEKIAALRETHKPTLLVIQLEK